MTPRLLQVSQAAAGVALSEEAGWNQSEADWRFMIEAGAAFGLHDDDERLVATALVLPLGADFAWISMVLVTAAFQRRGIATGLLRHCIADIEGRGLVAGLDATPAGREVYRPLGFEEVYGLHRLQAANGPRWAAPVAVPAGVTVEIMRSDDIEAVVAFDTQHFGGDRAALLKHLATGRPEGAWLARLDASGEVAGYILGREGREMRQVGPLLAMTEPIALDLAERALSDTQAPVYMDVADHHEGLNAWLASRGFLPQRPFTRMLKGRAAPFDDPRHVFAIAGPELG